MFGQNPLRPPEKGDGSMLNIVEIFPTLQGEGPFVGQPSVFVRLGGCNLACDFCDTEFEDFREMDLGRLVAEIVHQAGSSPSPLASEARWGGVESGNALTDSPPPQPSPQGGGSYLRDLVVITGGEPLRQEIGPLCAALLARGLRVQIETNGTLWRPLPEGVNIVCSPKMSGGRYHPLRPDMLARVDALKFIVSADHAEYREVGQVGQAGTRIPVYVQPMDVGDGVRNKANLVYALELAQTRGYRLSLQMHKLLDIA